MSPLEWVKVNDTVTVSPALASKRNQFSSFVPTLSSMVRPLAVKGGTTCRATLGVCCAIAVESDTIKMSEIIWRKPENDFWVEKEKKGEKGKTQKKQRKTFNTDCTNTEITQALRTKTLASPLQLQRRGKKRRKKERKTEARTEGRDEPFTETPLPRRHASLNAWAPHLVWFK